MTKQQSVPNESAGNRMEGGRGGHAQPGSGPDAKLLARLAELERENARLQTALSTACTGCDDLLTVTALNEDLRERYIPESVLKGEANLLVFPNLESANLSMTLLKEMTNALAVGPILMGPRAPAHILAPSTTSRGIVNMAAIAASEAISSEA